MLADAHYALYCKLQELHNDNLSQADLDAIPFRQCYMYGTSTANIRIERLWGELIARQTKAWLVSLRLSLGCDCVKPEQ
jgi:hypothetical protein